MKIKKNERERKQEWRKSKEVPYSQVPNNRGVLISAGGVGGGPTDNLNINKPGSPNKVRRGGGGWKMFSVKSGNLLSLIMGVCYKTFLHKLSLELLLHWTKLERQIKVILQSHSQGILKYMYLKPPWSSYIGQN